MKLFGKIFEHNQPKEISLRDDLTSSLAHANRIFKAKAYKSLDENSARLLSKAFSYQCEDAMKYLDLLKESADYDIQISNIEFKINFLAYVDETVNMEFGSRESVALALQEGDRLLENFKYYITIKTIRNE